MQSEAGTMSADPSALGTAELRPLLAAMNALRDGDFTVRAGERYAGHDGPMAELAAAFDQIVAQNAHLASELQRIRREVVRGGRLDERVTPSPGRGMWAASVDAANQLVEGLVVPVSNATRVLEAVADGDLTRRLDMSQGNRQLRGELGRLVRVVNRMVDRLALFSGRVTRVAREVGTEGRLGGQARIQGLSGDWRDAVEAVNTMASRLTDQVRDIADVTTAVARGDLTQQVTVEATGELLELKTTINTIVQQLSAFADEVTRVAREVGTEGLLGGQAHVHGVSGVWKDLTDNVNLMASNLTAQVRNIAQVTTAVAEGDLSKKIDVYARGEILELKTTVNTMVDTLSAFADEVTRVAREVGSDGRLGGRAQVHGVSGVWRGLTDNVNFMADNLTSQVRNIAQIATAVAEGDLSKKIDVDAHGEILELKTTINTMVDTLSAFADEVTRVAREVGTEGQLGGQARVEGVHGTWKRLTTGVNELASNLTTQVRAIAEVASEVAAGDMSGSVDVDAQGEVAELKNNVNLMVANLRETTRAKDWLTRIAALTQGRRELPEIADLILHELTPLVNAQFGALFLAADDSGPGGELRLVAAYGTDQNDGSPLDPGTPARGLVTQAAVEKKRILITDVPPDYITISSGLGSTSASSVVIVPILFEDEVLGVMELASLRQFSKVHLAFIDQFVDTIGVSINTTMAGARTEALLTESQRLTAALQQRTEQLQGSNVELEEQAALLATASQYKSEFLANMSHELRTPLNSLLILARLLADNPDGRLSEQEVQFADTIYRSGSDLLQLINDILDLSKVEAGRMDLRPRDLPLTKLLNYVEATFQPLAEERSLDFRIVVADDVPRELFSDEQRLQQILRNLLSNAIKFTSRGGVEMRVERVPSDRFEEETLRSSDAVVAFAVQDTGIGIAPEQLPVVFDAFQQSDGTTSRKYGGTGLGLSISRKIAAMLGGRIVAESEQGVGSTFTLQIPLRTPETPPAFPGDVPAAAGELPDRHAPAPPSVDMPLQATAEPGSGREDSGERAAEEKAAGDGAAAGQQGGRERPTGPAAQEGPGAAVPGPPPRETPARETPAQEPPARETPAQEPSAGDTGAQEPEADADESGHLARWTKGRAARVLNGLRVLIVDDDIRNVFALTHVLGRVGITVVYAENGREGLDVLHRDPDLSLVLMDIMMPDMDGYETMRTIRSTPRLADLPIIALTAKAMVGDRQKAIDSGANDYVPKPVDIDRLLTAITDLLDPRDGRGPGGPGGDAA
jgi:signal transduction histidine kinase/HAMP domain-containing protein/ActR/RegA family two-component response regulator